MYVHSLSLFLGDWGFIFYFVSFFPLSDQHSNNIVDLNPYDQPDEHAYNHTHKHPHDLTDHHQVTAHWHPIIL